MSANRLKLNTDKTELVWTGSKYNLASAGCSNLSLTLGGDVISPSDHVRLLGVTDMSLMSASHVSSGFAS